MPPPPADQILTIGAFTRQLKGVLEGQFADVWLQGEISNLRRQASGHLYFSLKDSDAQISAVLFRGAAARVNLDLRDGLAVVVSGEISVYEARGQYQIIVRQVLEAGVGRLQAAFEELKRKLAAEGLFAAERKRELPQRPRVVGFVTSPTGAALRDFISILRRRQWTGRLVVFPARVQGSEAAGEIARMIGLVPRLPELDLLVVGRGGGSLEDLWPFNEEVVVRALAACPVPTISAVGHEIDFTLSDFVADRRAETPSAAAELITSLYLAALDETQAVADRLDRAWQQATQERRHALKLTSAHLARLSPQARLEKQYLHLDDLESRLEAAVRQRLLTLERRLARLAEGQRRHEPTARTRLARSRFDSLAQRFTRASAAPLPPRHERLPGPATRLPAADPRNALRRGYTLVRDASGTLLPRRADVVAPGPLTIEFADGVLAVIPGDSPSPPTPPRRPRRAAPKDEANSQGDLFGG